MKNTSLFSLLFAVFLYFCQHISITRFLATLLCFHHWVTVKTKGKTLIHKCGQAGEKQKYHLVDGRWKIFKHETHTICPVMKDITNSYSTSFWRYWELLFFRRNKISIQCMGSPLEGVALAFGLRIREQKHKGLTVQTFNNFHKYCPIIRKYTNKCRCRWHCLHCSILLKEKHRKSKFMQTEAKYSVLRASPAFTARSLDSATS